MTTLILCIDRDDDLGIKADVTAPVIGREDNIKAAVALALADPGDTDSNSIFAAVKLYDELNAEGMDVEVATLTGHMDAGRLADERIMEQLDTVISKVHPDGVYFVSDGAEDEHILPLIQNFVKVKHIERVVIKKQKTIEDTYYAIVRILEDEKMQKKFVVPAALILIALSIITISGYFEAGLALLGILIGLILLIKAYKLETPMLMLINDIRHAIETKRYITTFSGTLALVISILGLIRGLTNGIVESPMTTAVNILYISLWYLLGAILIYVVGVTVDVYVKEKRFIWSVIGISFIIASTGFLGTAVLEVLHYYLAGEVYTSIEVIFLYALIGSFIMLFGTTIYRYIREHIDEETPVPITWQR